MHTHIFELDISFSNFNSKCHFLSFYWKLKTSWLFFVRLPTFYCNMGGNLILISQKNVIKLHSRCENIHIISVILYDLLNSMKSARISFYAILPSNKWINKVFHRITSSNEIIIREFNSIFPYWNVNTLVFMCKKFSWYGKNERKKHRASASVFSIYTRYKSRIKTARKFKEEIHHSNILSATKSDLFLFKMCTYLYSISSFTWTITLWIQLFFLVFISSSYYQIHEIA